MCELDGNLTISEVEIEACEDNNEIEEQASQGIPRASYGGILKNAPGCSTLTANALSQQLIYEVNLLVPDVLVSFDELNVRLYEAVYPFVQLNAKQALAKAIAARGRTMVVNSAYRTLVQQFLLYKWKNYRPSCRYHIVAPPGSSNHQGGLAIDIQDHLGWKPYLERYGWDWFGPGDKPHFTYRGGGTKEIRSSAVKAFQRLWNKNHPNDKIAEDGMYGGQTSSRLDQSPAHGFKIAPWDEKPRLLRLSHPLMEGSDVRQLQQALQKSGFELRADGVYGKNTINLVKQFQEQQELVVDGITGAKTREKLFATPEVDSGE